MLEVAGDLRRAPAKFENPEMKRVQQFWNTPAEIMIAFFCSLFLTAVDSLYLLLNK